MNQKIKHTLDKLPTHIAFSHQFLKFQKHPPMIAFSNEKLTSFGSGRESKHSVFGWVHLLLWRISNDYAIKFWPNADFKLKVVW